MDTNDRGGGQINDVIIDVLKALGHGKCSYFIYENRSSDIVVDKLSLGNDISVFTDTIDDRIVFSPTYHYAGSIINWRGRKYLLYQLVDDGEGHDVNSPEADNYCYMIMESGNSALDILEYTRDKWDILKGTARALILTRDLELYR